MTSKADVFIIYSPDYTDLHSGVRCLFLLCHHLNRLGFQAYITGKNGPSHLLIRYADKQFVAERRARGCNDIVLYPEIKKGNPLGGPQVVRYLLNVPGAFSDVRVGVDYGSDDYIVHYAREYRHPQLKSRELKIPLVDRAIFNRKGEARNREGFVIYSGRHAPDPSSIPQWVSPRKVISRQEPMDPKSLAALYRKSRALVVWEHTAATGEAMHCGCAVILVPRPGVSYRLMALRCLGCGYTSGWSEKRLRWALKTVGVAVAFYRIRHAGLDWRLRKFVRQARRYFFIRRLRQFISAGDLWNRTIRILKCKFSKV